MTAPILTVHVDPGPETTEPAQEGLRKFNESHVGPYRRERLAVIAEDEHGDFLGGIEGVSLFGWLYVERLWVPEEHRGRGIGGALLGRIENSAVEMGARRAALLTTTWQAPDFYLKRGYETVASFELTVDTGRGHEEAVDYLLVKDLD